ncbi:caspase-3-like [Mytilus galloprovincialis]|uniref:caspase-3-like n=1 Tax=Mytilus galloprovincialis TaxID=29158 RepID=UPI003F7BE79A
MVYQEIPMANREHLCAIKGCLAKQKREDLSRSNSKKSTATSPSAMYSESFGYSSIPYMSSLSRPISKKSNATSRSATFSIPFNQSRALPLRPDDNVYSSGITRRNTLTSDYESGLNSIYCYRYNQDNKNNSESHNNYVDLNRNDRDADPGLGDDQSWNFNRLYFCDREDSYPMNKQKRGCAIIFNVENVGGRIRNGTDIDVTRLKKCFNLLGFDVLVKQNPTREEIYYTMAQYASYNHNNEDCFVCVILSHGRDGHIKSTLNEEVSLQAVMDHVKNCRTLLGKPKLFFVQACRGNSTDHGITTDAEGDMNNAHIYKLSTHTDVLVSYATVQDYVAYRNGRNGSIYIMILSELLCREGFTTKLTEILSKVTDMTSKALADVCQVPWFTSTLTKSLLFTRKRRVIRHTLHYDDGTNEEIGHDELLELQ